MSFRGRSAGLLVGTAAVALGIGLLAGPAARAFAQEDPQAAVIVRSIQLADADLRAAVNAVTSQASVDIVIEPGEYKPITLTLTNKPLSDVLTYICKAAGASLRVEGGTYFIGPQRATPEPPKTMDSRPQEPDAGPPARLRTEKVRLQWSRPSAILEWLRNEDPSTFNNDVERQMLRGTRPENTPRSDVQPFSGPVKPTMLSVPTVPPVVPTGDQSPSAARSDESGQFGRPGGGYGGGGYGGYGGGGGQLGGFGGGGQFGGGGRLGGGGGQLGGFGGGGQLGGGNQQGSLVPEGITSVIAYDVDNTLIVRGTDEGIRELKDIIRLLDVAPRQLSIRADFIEAHQDDVRTFGIDWSVARGAFQAGTGGAFASGDVFINYATGNLVSSLRTSLVEGRGRIINSPMATTMNNILVQIQLQTSLPVITNQVVFGGQGNGVVVPQVSTITVGSGLIVLPRINGDNSITMLVQPYISDIVSQVANPAGGTLPIYTQQSISVVRRIANDETMVIGGLIKKNDSTSTHKVPLLADIPLIGQLFRGTSTTVNDSELLIFITPHIIPDRGGAAATAAGASTSEGGVAPGVNRGP